MSYVNYYMENHMQCESVFVDYSNGLELHFSCLDSLLQFLDSYQRISDSEPYEYEAIATLHDDSGMYDIRYERGTTGYYYAERTDIYKVGYDGEVYRCGSYYDCPRASY